MAAAGLDLNAQEPSPGSLYIPKPQLVEDRKLLLDFMDEFAFADLVTASPGIRITHIPTFLNRTAATYGTRVRAHLAPEHRRANVLTAISPPSSCSAVRTVIFRLPGTTSRNPCPPGTSPWCTPRGRPKPITDPKALHDLLAQLIAKFEGPGSSYNFAKLPESYTNGLIGGIIGFEMQIELLEGKFKLGQERSDADKQAILKNLASAKPARSIYEFTAEFYKRG